jgi:hypothetical protein
MESTENEKPPVFRKWSSWYWLVIVVMLVQVIIYSLITFSFP